MDQAAATISLKANPTIAAGDFKVSTDGGAFANLTTLPVVTPAAGRAVKITLSAAEMTGSNIMVMCVDAAGAEWCDLCINIQTTPLDASVVQIDGTANASATLNLKKLNVVNNSGDAAVFSSTGSNGHGIAASGNGTGSGMSGTGGVTGNGILGTGGATSGAGLYCVAPTLGAGINTVGAGSGNPGILATGGTNGPGISGVGSGSGSGATLQGGLTGHGVQVIGGATSGSGIYAYAVGSGNGITATGASNGAGLAALGNGSGSGVLAQGGATGHGVNGVGGATSGSGLYANAAASGAGITAVGVGGVSLLATQGISGPLDATERDAIALAALKYDWTGITGEAARSTLNALRFLRNKWSISGTTMTVTKENDSTSAWTSSLTIDAAASPVVGSDPA